MGEIDLKYINQCLLVIAFMSPMALAADPDEQIEFITDENVLKEAVRARTTQGVIESVDVAERSAIIGGYIYDFGPPDMRIPVEVKMYNSNYGAFELLQPGMKVEIVYGDVGDMRLAVRVKQLSNNAVIEDM